MKEVPGVTKGPYILWTDYGSEGWSPRSYDTQEDMAKAILDYPTGSPVVATKRLDLIFSERKDGQR